MTTRSIRVLLTFGTLFLLIPVSLIAQLQRDVVPLKPWPAPLYWQPTEAENQIAATPGTFGNAIAQDTRPANSLVFVGMTPCRVVDTRTGSGFTGAFGPPSLVDGAKRTFPIQSSTNCSIPSIAQAYSFNITIVPPGFVDFVTVGPTPVSTPPTFSTLNGYVCAFSSSPCVISNAAIVPAGTSGSVDVYASQNTNLIVDINGYYAPQSGLTLTQGTAGAPSLSFSGDAGTGIFSSGSGTLTIATGGTSRLTVRSDGDLELPGSIRKGGTLFLHNRGLSDNTALGLGALAVNSGWENTASGFAALGSNTTGSYNTANGSLALNLNTSGSNNTASGFQALFSNTSGHENTASGYQAMQSNTTGVGNTASGFAALASNSTGFWNTATGAQALLSNTTGLDNTASGFAALSHNTAGNDNTASGEGALYLNTTGNGNTAGGSGALFSNTTGSGNTASGATALTYNTTGGYDTASGMTALYSNTTGAFNTASGFAALYHSITGNDNTAAGYQALFSNTIGSGNTASGREALSSNTAGNNNIAIGYLAGVNLTGTSNNIHIGNRGLSTDDSTIRIGTGSGDILPAHNRIFLAAVRSVTTDAADAVNVVIDSNGQLGTINSSRRFKEDVQDMGEASSGLLRLRPVTFRYKRPYEDGSKPLDYGLIAEEVTEVFPDLVVKGSDGQVETVQYQKLTPMLLNEVQKQHERLQRQEETIRQQQEQNRKLEERLAALEVSLSGKTN